MAVKRANRTKSWQFQAYKVLESEYPWEGNTIRFIHLGATDSVNIYGPAYNLIYSFYCDRGGRIIRPVYFNYPSERGIMNDSIAPGKGGRFKWYFEGFLYSDAVRSTTDRQGETKMYYDSKGKDSLWIVHSSAKLRLMTWYRNGEDSLQRRWNERGALEYEKTNYSELTWDADQKLVKQAFDTLIRDKHVWCTKTWYATGVLESIAYHYFGQPCLTWKYYNEKGKLIEQARQGDLDKLWPGGIVVAEPEVFRFVEQQEDVVQQLKQQLNDKLAALLCRTKVKPKGTYQLQVKLDTSGKLILQKMEGADAELLQADMAAIFNQLSRAKPAKRNGRTYARLLQVSLVVKEKGNKQ